MRGNRFRKSTLEKLEDRLALAGLSLSIDLTDSVLSIANTSTAASRVTLTTPEPDYSGASIAAMKLRLINRDGDSLTLTPTGGILPEYLTGNGTRSVLITLPVAVTGFLAEVKYVGNAQDDHLQLGCDTETFNWAASTSRASLGPNCAVTVEMTQGGTDSLVIDNVVYASGAARDFTTVHTGGVNSIASIEVGGPDGKGAIRTDPGSGAILVAGNGEDAAITIDWTVPSPGFSRPFVSGDFTLRSATVRVNRGLVAPAAYGSHMAISAADIYLGDGTGRAGSAVVRLGENNQIAIAARIWIASDGRLDLAGHNQTIASLDMAGGSVLTGVGTLILGGDVTTHESPVPATIRGKLNLGAVDRVVETADGAALWDLDIDALISGAGGLLKWGDGALRLRGPGNTFTGATTIHDGTLRADSSNLRSAVDIAGRPGDVVINTFSSGPGVVAIGRLGAPQVPDDPARISIGGDSTAGLLLARDRITLSGGTTLRLDLNGLTPGTQYDQLRTAGQADLGGAVLRVTASRPFAPERVFTILRAGSVVGQFANAASGSIVRAAGTGQTFRVVITANAVMLVADEVVARRLDFTLQPPRNVRSGTLFGCTIEARDARGRIDTNYNGLVTLSIQTGPDGGQLSGTVTVRAVHGVATFQGLRLNRSGNYVLRVEAPGVSFGTISGLSHTVRVTVGRLVFAVLPSSATPNAPFTVVVRAVDADGVTATNYAGPITLSLIGDSPGSLQGSLTVTGVRGVATFTGLRASQAGSYRLRAIISSISADALQNPLGLPPGSPLVAEAMLTIESPYHWGP